MIQLDKTINNYRVTVFAPTDFRATWRVNVDDGDTAEQGHAFYRTEADALAAVNEIADGRMPDEMIFV